MEENQIITRSLFTPGGVHIREAQEEGKESRTIAGYAILFDTPSRALYKDDEYEMYEIISRNAITQDILDVSDIKMTLFHFNSMLLARSKSGKGTLTYGIDAKGIYFEFEAPRTMEGDKALELVKRGDLDGCSFQFSTKYYDLSYVSRSSVTENGVVKETFVVEKITGLYDFTLTANPAYVETSCEVRDLVDGLKSPKVKETPKEVLAQISEMRREAKIKL